MQRQIKTKKGCQMNHPTGETEVIRGETWCTSCRQPVDRWNVSFETTIHTDVGYEKILRCPHCNEMCFDDGNFSFGCLLFFVGIFGSPFVWSALMRLTGVNEPEPGGELGGWFVVFTFVSAIALSTGGMWALKKFMRRRGPEGTK